jgi:hypothetical protein
MLYSFDSSIIWKKSIFYCKVKSVTLIEFLNIIFKIMLRNINWLAVLIKVKINKP